MPDGGPPVHLGHGNTEFDGPSFHGPMFSESFIDGSPSGDFGFEGPCPGFGDYHGPMGCQPGFGDEGRYGPLTRNKVQQPCRVFADLQFNFMRLHLMENAVGKLSEKYEFSPRFTLGFNGSGIVDGRARYWIYERATSLLDGGEIRVELNVFDLEATHCFKTGNSDITVAAGVRFANLDLVDDDGDGVGNDLLGMTLGADAHTLLCKFQYGQVAWVYGGRLSILGGDWGGNPDNDLIPAPVHDDSVLVEAIYAGVQVARSFRDYQLVGRLAFEMQNWHSDALSQFGGADSIRFLGPGVHVGAAF
jgi:hypothetical protein